MQCQKCSNEIAVGSKYCNNCGEQIVSKKKTCPNPECGVEDIPDDALFCPGCGKQFPESLQVLQNKIIEKKSDLVQKKEPVLSEEKLAVLRKEAIIQKIKEVVLSVPQNAPKQYQEIVIKIFENNFICREYTKKFHDQLMGKLQFPTGRYMALSLVIGLGFMLYIGPRESEKTNIFKLVLSCISLWLLIALAIWSFIREIPRFFENRILSKKNSEEISRLFYDVACSSGSWDKNKSTLMELIENDDVHPN